jgi:hypothetical protein
MKATHNPVINQFIIEASLINPVSKIINQLNNGEFRDCDIKWLDNKLENFTKFACETLGISVLTPSGIGSEKYTLLNDYVKNKYIKHFNTLLDYFKSI